ncbi:MAG: iron-sulfur cluster carrier protein ApbC [Halothiobacillaceae bacterium]|nr:iron-sulfur cluster carrier protein ApbC [Halothiobacillaceae bacterium]HER35518.1 iron-sulfur cluster carrier protein ApbC [Halothiobacillaceae bacterium]
MGLFGNKRSTNDVPCEDIERAVAAVSDPNSGQTLAESGAIERFDCKGKTCQVDIVLDYPPGDWEGELTDRIREAVATVDESAEAEITVAFVAPEGSAMHGKPLPGVKNVIAVASGKGGVGKSSTSVNLALALLADGARVGLLDADIYGPSQPRMLGTSDKPQQVGERSMSPVMAHGLQTMSIGYLVDDESAMVWRGPMVTSALMQLLNDTRWDQLDYLIVDMPPGTGDVQLTLAQKVPVAGSVIVTTPQEIATLDARKAINMFNKVQVPILGVIENMATHVCSNCGHVEAVFGEGGGAAIAAQYDTELLGQLPLNLRIREDLDAGTPTVAKDPDGALAHSYRQAARRLAAGLGRAVRSEGQSGPEIVIEE